MKKVLDIVWVSVIVLMLLSGLTYIVEYQKEISIDGTVIELKK